MKTRHIAHLHLHGDPGADRYAQVLEQLGAITPHVQPCPPDAVQLDLTSALRYFDCGPYELLQMVQMRITGLFGLQTSAGLAPNRMLAAMAAATTPPGKTTRIRGDQTAIDAWLRPRPVTALPGIGRRTATNLSRFGLRCVGDVADLPAATLQRLLGAPGARLLAERARGHDPRPVTPEPQALHLTVDDVLEQDCLDPVQHHRAVLHLAQQLGARLRDADQITGRLTLTVRYADRSSTTRTRTLSEPTAHSPALATTALGLLESLALQRARLRAYTLRADRLHPADQARHQLSLDPADNRARTAEAVADRARHRYGHDAIQPATLANHRP